MVRRNFIKSTAGVLGYGIFHTHISLLNTFKTRKFRICLNPGIIGVSANQAQTLNYCIEYGYEAMISMPNELMNYSEAQLDELTGKMQDHDISWGSTNIPVEYRKSKTQFNNDFQDLRKHCEIMEKVGASRMNTWVLSFHQELTYNENFKLHAYRLGECAKVMKDHGIRLGMEYLGPRTMMTSGKYPFIGSMREMKELIEAMGETNVGFVLDSFHWYCADDNADDIRTLSPEDIITVDINDAMSNVARIDQKDGSRELPASTGVIDIKSFLQALLDIGYDGPLRTEPFNKSLNDLENQEALKLNLESINKAFALVGE